MRKFSVLLKERNSDEQYWVSVNADELTSAMTGAAIFIRYGDDDNETEVFAPDIWLMIETVNGNPSPDTLERLYKTTLIVDDKAVIQATNVMYDYKTGMINCMVFDEVEDEETGTIETITYSATVLNQKFYSHVVAKSRTSNPLSLVNGT